MVDRRARLRTGPSWLQRGTARLCAARTPARPRRRVGRQAGHSGAVAAGRDNDAVVRRLSGVREDFTPSVRIRISDVAAAGAKTPVRSAWLVRTMHLRRSGFET